MEIAAVCKIAPKDDGTFTVPSQSGKGRYDVRLGDEPHCTCPDHEQRACKCKHIFAVEFAVKREQNADGTETVTESVTISQTVTRPTYPQNWPAYNAAQTNEKRHFQALLADLCSNVTNPPQGMGRRRLPLSDAVFAVVFKVYSTFSGRRFTSDLCDAQTKGYISRIPHFNSVFNYFEDEAVGSALSDLITASSLSLRGVECDFAADSTGFTTSRFVRWYDHKYGAIRQEHDWVKAHVMCGVKTNIITAVEIHGRDAQDSPILPSLAATTRRSFNMREVSADKGYSSIANAEKIAAMGATPFISYKVGHTGKGGGTWGKMFHYFQFNREDFLAHYHKRSNVESTMMMVKSKFGNAVRSKTDAAMKNEVLAKVLCHNICCNISAMYELGIVPMFCKDDERTGCTKSAVPAQNLLLN